MEKTIGYFIRKICILYLLIWSVSPPMEIGTPYRIAALLCAGVWLVLSIISKPRINKFLIACVIYTALVCVVSYSLYGGFSGVLSQIAVLMLLVGVWVYYYYRGNWQELSGIHIIIILLLILWNLITIRTLFAEPHIMRYIVRDDVNYYSYLRRGVGGYGLIYSQVCVFPVATAWTVSSFKKNRFFFVLGLVWVSTILIMVFKAGYLIAILATLCSVIPLLLKGQKSFVTSLVIIALLLISGLLLLVYSEGFRDYLLQLFSGTALEKKINDLMVSVTDKTVYGSIASRWNAYTNSITTMLGYPVVGSLFAGGGGGHSAILDMFARYGLFGGIVYTRMILTSTVDELKGGTGATRRIMNGAIVAILIVALFDTLKYSFMLMFTVMIPLLVNDIKRRQENIKRAPTPDE